MDDHRRRVRFDGCLSECSVGIAAVDDDEVGVRGERAWVAGVPGGDPGVISGMDCIEDAERQAEVVADSDRRDVRIGQRRAESFKRWKRDDRIAERPGAV